MSTASSPSTKNVGSSSPKQLQALNYNSACVIQRAAKCYLARRTAKIKKAHKNRTSHNLTTLASAEEMETSCLVLQLAYRSHAARLTAKRLADNPIDPEARRKQNILSTLEKADRMEVSREEEASRFCLLDAAPFAFLKSPRVRPSSALAKAPSQQPKSPSALSPATQSSPWAMDRWAVGASSPTQTSFGCSIPSDGELLHLNSSRGASLSPLRQTLSHKTILSPRPDSSSLPPVLSPSFQKQVSFSK